MEGYSPDINILHMEGSRVPLYVPMTPSFNVKGKSLSLI